jgi:ABC-type branched-subunit amino acid transport system substrate-binding protein
LKKNGPVRLGLLAPLSGLVSMYGVEISNAAHIACAEVNRAGGVLGRPLKLIVEDDGSVAESAVLAAEKLIKKSHCVSLIGNLLSNARISVTHQVAEPLRVPLLNFSFYEGSIFSPYFFHFAALPNQQIDKMMPFMRKQFGPKMFFAGNNYEWPRGSIDASKQALLACGGTISGEEYYPLGLPESDLETLINRLSISEADVFVPYFAGADQVRVLKKFTEKGLKPKMAVVMGHFDEIMMSHLSASVRGVFFQAILILCPLILPRIKNFSSNFPNCRRSQEFGRRVMGS